MNAPYDQAARNATPLPEGPLRILTVANVPSNPNSGAAGTVFHTNRAFRELGHHVEEIWSDRLGPRRINHGNLHSLLEQPRAYRREILKATRNQPFDAVLISQPQGYLAAKALKHSGFEGVVINRSHGLELRVDEVLPHWRRRMGFSSSRHPVLTGMLRPLLQRQWAETLKWFDGIVLPCVDDREFLVSRTRCDPSQLATIHHGVPESFLTEPVLPMTANRRNRMLFIGQHSFIKGPDLLVEIVNQTLAASPNMEMTWVTSKEDHQWIRERLAPEIADRVTLQGWVLQVELLPLLDSHGIFVFPSFFEGAGKACAEALARGMLVVASETGGMRDHLREVMPDGLCQVGDTEAFIKRILAFANSDAINVNRLATSAAYCQKLTWANCAQQLVAFFRQQKAANRNFRSRHRTDRRRSP
ncbi:glycosyltransferase family 4 protein [Rhodopirellula sp. MGV]|uniref:glycosyltransferase family 4 protein n=1 Tax=Rhodopirellula sp. MGV TaxID=2023130 RepID=UPI001303F812|nr:glycosyltransferase family 4 protein [Rhodopirellula sp. MGV]